jgi:hypothetical protein
LRDRASIAAKAARPSGVSAIRLWRASRRRLADDQPGFREAAQDAAEIAGVEPELLAELGRRRSVPLRDLVDDARLGQREPAAEQPFLEHADPARVEAREAADPVDFFGCDVHAGHGTRISEMVAGVNQSPPACPAP